MFCSPRLIPLSTDTRPNDRNFYDELWGSCAAGVATASLGRSTPGLRRFGSGLLWSKGTHREGERMTADVTYVSPDYFKSLGIPLVQGRDFDQQDRIGSPKVVLVNEKLARHFFGDTNVIGKKIGLDKLPDITIVGVVKDATYINLREDLRRHFYLPTSQEPRLADLALHIKTQGDPGPVAEQLRVVLKNLDPHLPLYNVKTLASEIDESLVQERLVSWPHVRLWFTGDLAALGLLC